MYFLMVEEQNFLMLKLKLTGFAFPELSSNYKYKIQTYYLCSQKCPEGKLSQLFRNIFYFHAIILCIHLTVYVVFQSVDQIVCQRFSVLNTSTDPTYVGSIWESHCIHVPRWWDLILCGGWLTLVFPLSLIELLFGTESVNICLYAVKIC